MKKFFIAMLSIIFLCSNAINVDAASSKKTNEKAIKKVLSLNLKYTNEENLKGYKTTIDCSQADCDNTLSLLKDMFDTYDIKVKLVIKKITIKGSKAKVEVKQTSKKIAGPEYKDNETVLYHYLVKKKGKWKIVGTEIKSVKFLN